MEDKLRQLGIDYEGSYNRDGAYVIQIPDSNEYGKVYTKLEMSPELKEDDSVSMTTHEMSSIVYESDDYTFTLMANLDDDVYQLTVKEKR